jgi:hypothetical protein
MPELMLAKNAHGMIAERGLVDNLERMKAMSDELNNRIDSVQIQMF